MSGDQPTGVPVPGITPDSATLAVVVARLDDLRGDVRALGKQVESGRLAMVPRNEWIQRNSIVDERFQRQGADIVLVRTDLTSDIVAVATSLEAYKTEQAAKRAPWWSVAAIALSGGALAWTILGPLIVAAR